MNQIRRVGGQKKSQNLVNVVCERPLNEIEMSILLFLAVYSRVLPMCAGVRSIWAAEERQSSSNMGADTGLVHICVVKHTYIPNL